MTASPRTGRIVGHETHDQETRRQAPRAVLEALFLSRPEIAEKTAGALARASQNAFASVRVTALSLARTGGPLGTLGTLAKSANRTPAATEPAPADTNPVPQSAAGSDGGNDERAAFDSDAIGLLPTFQREGANGLMKRLAEITSADHLRKMARAQQVALPADLRKDGADADAIREAIVKAVAKRIADRRAAAG